MIINNNKTNNTTYSTSKFDYEVEHLELYHLWESIIAHPTKHRLTSVYNNNGSGLPVTCLLRHVDEVYPIGSLSVYPCEISIDGNKNIKAGINFDMMISKKYRTLGPALMLMKGLTKLCIDQGFQLIIGMPNEKSQPVFKRVGYEYVGDAYRWSKVLKFNNKLSTIIKSKILRIIISPFVNVAMRWTKYNVYYQLRYWRSIKNIDVRDISIEDLDLNFENNNQYNNKKSIQYYDWRYKGINPSVPDIIGIYQDKRLIGFVIYYFDKNEIIVQEVYSEFNDYRLFILLSKFISNISKGDAHSISIRYFGSKDFEKILKKLGFFKREGRGVFVMSIDSDINIDLSSFSLFDGELDL